LGGVKAPRSQRVATLLHALRHTEVKGSPEVEKGVATLGFKPLQEFLGSPVCQFGPFLMPGDGEWRKEWRYAIATAYLVFIIQLLAPIVILVDKWDEDGNRLMYLKSTMQSLSVGELFCAGTRTSDRLHTGMGGALLALVLIIIHAYVGAEMGNVVKSGRLPTDRFWYFMSSIANWWCTLAVTFTAPVLFWSEDSATSIAMDSLTILFIFLLDDLAGYAAAFLGKSDEDFQRMTAWNFALLSQCPVQLRDLVNPKASSPQDFWQFQYDDHMVLAAGGTEPCEKRLQDATPQDLKRHHRWSTFTANALPQPSVDQDERLPLLPASNSQQSQSPFSSPNPTPRDEGTRDKDLDALRYRVNSANPNPDILPRVDAVVLNWIWFVLFCALHVCVFVFPITWMMVNKPCEHRRFEAFVPLPAN